MQAVVRVAVRLFERQPVVARQHILYPMLTPVLPIILSQIQSDHRDILQEVEGAGSYEDYIRTLHEEEELVKNTRKRSVQQEALGCCLSEVLLLLSSSLPSQPLLDALQPRKSLPTLAQP